MNKKFLNKLLGKIYDLEGEVVEQKAKAKNKEEGAVLQGIRNAIIKLQGTIEQNL